METILPLLYSSVTEANIEKRKQAERAISQIGNLTYKP